MYFLECQERGVTCSNGIIYFQTLNEWEKGIFSILLIVVLKFHSRLFFEIFFKFNVHGFCRIFLTWKLTFLYF